MKYIINLTLVFDPESKSLVLRNNSQLAIGLSNPATRLLTELIKNNRMELTRETLIKHVWEDFGFSPSSATLSNHISELRKAFEALGVSKDILLTVPRIGFKMDAEIHPETKPPKEPPIAEDIAPLLPVNEKTAVEDIIMSDSHVNSKKPLRKMNVRVLPFLLVLSVTAAVFAWSILNTHEQRALIGIQAKCRIYTLDEGKEEPGQLEYVRKMLTEEAIDCSQTNIDIYYMETRPANELLKVHFMAACTKSNDMGYTKCDNFKQVK
ncbi:MULTISPECIES: winged helix-turn-helix domain-containing protein [Serratia]|uniref:winged helix-turn-helix domain-containing protein n=1 Tax=Serratia TaxID=613 RepID=UPI0006601529|nr:winged helix-turn-helix domain-containing protein [Serratia sp. 506_PEND]